MEKGKEREEKGGSIYLEHISDVQLIGRFISSVSVVVTPCAGFRRRLNIFIVEPPLHT